MNSEKILPSDAARKWAEKVWQRDDVEARLTSVQVEVFNEQVRQLSGQFPRQYQFTLCLDIEGPDHNGFMLFDLWQAIYQNRPFITTPRLVTGSGLVPKSEHKYRGFISLFRARGYSFWISDDPFVIGLPYDVTPEQVGLSGSGIIKVDQIRKNLISYVPKPLSLSKLFHPWPPKTQWVITGHGSRDGVIGGIKLETMLELLPRMQERCNATLVWIRSCFGGGKQGRLLAKQLRGLPLLISGLDESVVSLYPTRDPCFGEGFSALSILGSTLDRVKEWTRRYLVPSACMVNVMQVVNQEGQLLYADGRFEVADLCQDKTSLSSGITRIGRSILDAPLVVDETIQLLPVHATTFLPEVHGEGEITSVEAFAQHCLWPIFSSPVVMPDGRMLVVGALKTPALMGPVVIDLEQLSAFYCSQKCWTRIQWEEGRWRTEETTALVAMGMICRAVEKGSSLWDRLTDSKLWQQEFVEPPAGELTTELKRRRIERNPPPPDCREIITLSHSTSLEAASLVFSLFSPEQWWKKKKDSSYWLHWYLNGLQDALAVIPEGKGYRYTYSVYYEELAIAQGKDPAALAIHAKAMGSEQR